jgi:hypothetical protein
MEETETVQVALAQLSEMTGVRGTYVANAHPADKGTDGSLILTTDKEEYRFLVMVKHNLRESHLSFLREAITWGSNVLVVTNYASDNIKQQLRKENVFYLDTSGNAYIKSDQFFIFVQGQKEKEAAKPKVNKVFNATGLKVLFALLNEPEMYTYNYRYIAQHSGVALGSVAAIMQDLKELEYLVQVDEQTWKLKDRKALLDRYVMEYGENLRPKLFAGKYRFLNAASHWQDLKLNRHKTYWGGEPAADLLTHYLKPEQFILYSSESKAELMKNYRLVPDSGGNVTVYSLFWYPDKYPKWQLSVAVPIVPPVLVYADLMLTNDSRTTETAHKVYEQQLSHLI